ncbi:hypothetical protein D5396_22270 [Rahnella inusitata]|jgi:hypothetical protein|uniref:Uncharacterized protein n=1 Tax=Rahnella inusitata TaxID=58169 RepID=A0ABX9NUC2_9GAMM|nr:hypothetical protein D5396_22270 [Rahnella inusitata]
MKYQFIGGKIGVKTRGSGEISAKGWKNTQSILLFEINACAKNSDPYNAAPSTGNNVNNITK